MQFQRPAHYDDLSTILNAKRGITFTMGVIFLVVYASRCEIVATDQAHVKYDECKQKGVFVCNRDEVHSLSW